LLINLSNHSLSSWGKKQTEEAVRQFGSITDIPFPSVDSETGQEEIAKLAKEYLEECLSLLSRHREESNAVHLMGELTFTHNLVKLLKRKGVKCVASTSERVTEVNGNKKVSEFNFVRFREY